MADVTKLAPYILKWEGGFVDHKADKGGATNMGVRIGTWRQNGYDKDGDGDIDVADLKLLTKQDVINRILKPHYWDRWKADQIVSQPIANILVDWVWGSGKWGIIIPQRLLGVESDGVVGQQTIMAVNKQSPADLFARINTARLTFLNDIVKNNPSQRVFLKGWINRLNDLKFV